MNAEHEALLRKGKLIQAAREAADALRDQPTDDNSGHRPRPERFRDFHPGNRVPFTWNPPYNIDAQNEEDRTIFLTAFRERLLEIRADFVRQHELDLVGLDSLIDGRAVTTFDSKWRSTLQLYQFDGEHYAGTSK